MSANKKSLNFIEHIIEDDLKNGLDKSKLRFRFPPEPNGYLHIGHAASICLNFGLGLKYNAPVNLRFDDTNPAKEEKEYVDAIKKDIEWLGFKWNKELYASNYFQILYDWAIKMINEGLAYIDDLSSEEMAKLKGTPTEPGVNSPNRNRSIAKNLDLFKQMKSGKLPEGSHVLRAKINMQHVNMHMRDPIMYRILFKSHHRTGTDWNIYPMYDWTHGESDYIENISHSFCTLEFTAHRELYDWYLDQIYTEGIRPKQREFARRNLSYTIMSKRKLLKLVEGNYVSGWDDPRMPTISGLRRRGYTANAIRNFSEISGISKRENVTDVALLEHCIKDDLNKTTPRVMAVLNPVKLVITNYLEDKDEILNANYNDYIEGFGSRDLPFSRELYIEKEDFREEANKKFFRLKLHSEVRLKNAYIIKANSVIKNINGEITEIHCTYDKESLSGSGTEASKRKVKGTLHWVSIKHAVKAEVRIYDRLFLDEAPDSHKNKDFIAFINPNSLTINTNVYVEPSLKNAKILDSFQFQRLGYFNVDKDSTTENLVFNRTVALRDSWAKKETSAGFVSKKSEVSILQKEIMPLAGKYLKSKEEEERLSLIANVFELSKQIQEEELLLFINTVVSNKDFLTALMLLNSKNIKIDFSNKINFNSVDELIKKALDMKNSYVRFQAVDCIGKYLAFKNNHITLLKTLIVKDKNTRIIERLKTYL
ncbi:MAG: glutamine--tRNA ligase/YqeY domain fusion protein [Flavobacteriaceae bacterium]|nr:glutamine--tRNA ligase/YqeY domain fusion protein [Flavobacteriaceae bacterium]